MSKGIDVHIDDLDDMNRRDLQALAKQHGVKANQKSSDIIASLSKVISAKEQSAAKGGISKAKRGLKERTVNKENVMARMIITTKTSNVLRKKKSILDKGSKASAPQEGGSNIVNTVVDKEESKTSGTSINKESRFAKQARTSFKASQKRNLEKIKERTSSDKLSKIALEEISSEDSSSDESDQENKESSTNNDESPTSSRSSKADAETKRNKEGLTEIDSNSSSSEDDSNLSAQLLESTANDESNEFRTLSTPPSQEAHAQEEAHSDKVSSPNEVENDNKNLSEKVESAQTQAASRGHDLRMREKQEEIAKALEIQRNLQQKLEQQRERHKRERDEMAQAAENFEREFAEKRRKSLAAREKRNEKIMLKALELGLNMEKENIPPPGKGKDRSSLSSVATVSPPCSPQNAP